MTDKHEKKESIRFSSIAYNNTKQPSNQKPISSRHNNDPIRVLKARFAKMRDHQKTIRRVPENA
jgi:hypothetical protein